MGEIERGGEGMVRSIKARKVPRVSRVEDVSERSTLLFLLWLGITYVIRSRLYSRVQYTLYIPEIVISRFQTLTGYHGYRSTGVIGWLAGTVCVYCIM